MFTVVSLTLLLMASPALTPTRCMTYEESTLGRLHTLCKDGTRAVSIYNRTLKRWDTTITPAPGAPVPCSRRLNPLTKRVEVRCRG